jgi:hypothetical protein
LLHAGLDAIIAASRQRNTPASQAHRADDGRPFGAAASSDDDPVEANTGAAARGSNVGDDAPTTSGRRAEGRTVSRRVPKSSLLRDEDFLADAGSDSSEDERPPRNTIGAVPLEWYRDEDHIGYDRYAHARTRSCSLCNVRAADRFVLQQQTDSCCSTSYCKAAPRPRRGANKRNPETARARL